MFTPDGELREDFRHLEESSADGPPNDVEAHDVAGESPAPPPVVETPESTPPPAAGSPAPSPVSPPAPSPAIDPASSAAPAGEPLGSATTDGSFGQPSFFELVGILAEPIALFLGDAQMPDGRSAEDLEAARFYIDLVEVLRQKTAGNLSAEESAALEDLLYRLRLRYVQKSG